MNAASEPMKGLRRSGIAPAVPAPCGDASAEYSEYPFSSDELVGHCERVNGRFKALECLMKPVRSVIRGAPSDAFE
jgi:hypothetical protein